MFAQTMFKYLEGWRLQSLSGQPVLMQAISLCLVGVSQVGACVSHPAPVHLQGQADSVLSHTPIQQLLFSPGISAAVSCTQSVLCCLAACTAATAQRCADRCGVAAYEIQ